MEDKVRGFSKSGTANMARLERGARATAEASRKVAVGAGVAGAAILAPLAYAANAAIGFEDKLADVAKTTGLTGVELDTYGEKILDLSKNTRTSVDDLLKISEIGGQFGIAKKELFGFTESVNMFNVAIGKDFSGGVEEAVSKVSSITSLFKETKSLDVASAIQKAGSAINELGAQGSGTSANIADFAIRMGGLPAALRPSVTSTLALGTYFQELGIDSQIASGGLTNFLLVAGRNISGFAEQMKISEKQAKLLLKTDPAAFASKFGQSLNGLSPEALTTKLGDLKIGTQESIKVLGSLGANTKRLTELQDIANKGFKDGTSLVDEYNKKNNTTAAQIQKAKNNFEALTITIGTELLPVINQLINKIVPVIKDVAKWVTENKELVKNITIAAGAIGGFLLVVSGISTVVAIVSEAIIGLTFVWGLLTAPIGLTVLAIGAVIAAVGVVMYYWDEWGASVTIVAGIIGAFFSPILAGFALVISIVQSFTRNWEGITKAFSEGRILDGILLIGSTIQDAILQPMQQLLELVGKFTGIDLFTNAANGLKEYRRGLGLNVGDEKYSKRDTSAFTLPGQLSQDGLNSFASAENGGSSVQMANPKLAQQEGLTSTFQSFEKQKIEIDIKDKTGQASVKSDNNITVPKLTSTMQ
jgi:TP901 family phage tail tape measure protein